MFVQNLNKNQQSVLLYLAREVAKADGNLHELQVGVMQIIRAQCESSVEEREVSLDELSEVFDNERVKCSLLLELIGIANANSEYHVSEKDLIGKYAQVLGFSANKLNLLDKWVEKQLVLMAEVEQLLN
ncbi:MAG: TerB family tellurite resistance protein [Psychrobacter sp.]